MDQIAHAPINEGKCNYDIPVSYKIQEFVVRQINKGNDIKDGKNDDQVNGESQKGRLDVSVE